jgi:hypothetical protein
VIKPIVVFAVILLSATAAAAQGQPKSPQEFCKSAKEPARCLATRALLARLKNGDRSARWTHDFSQDYIDSVEEIAALSRFSESAQAAPPDEYCRNVKERTKCLATRALIGQIKAKDKAARWNDDVDLDYAQNTKDQTLLTDFWVAVTPPPKPPAEYCRNTKDQKKCLVARGLLAQVIARDKTARWSSDVDYTYAGNDVEAMILFTFYADQRTQGPKRK